MYVGIYWNNHHHMLHAAEHVSGAGLWANLHLLFWLSLIPFVTAWMDENHLVAAPVALYGCVLLMAAIAYYILARILIRDNGPGIGIGKSLRQGYQGPHFHCVLRCRYRSIPVACVVGARDLRAGGDHVDHSRPQD